MSKPMYSWMNPKLEVRDDSEYGFGVFSTAKIETGEMLFVMSGYILTVEEENVLVDKGGKLADKPIEIHEYFTMSPLVEDDLARMPQHYVNHSCNPNAGFKGQIFMMAIKPINEHEEISYDYAMVMHSHPDSSSYFSMECHCGSPLCRGRVSEDDWQLPVLQKRYDGWFSWYLQDKIDQLKKSRKKQRRITC